MSRCMLCAALVSVALSLAPVVSAYQSQFIEFGITPQPAVVGAGITIEGWVYPHATDRTVKVRIDSPADAEGNKVRVVEDITCDELGALTWSWGPLDRPGTWHVWLKGPAKEEVAEEDFTVEPVQTAIISVGTAIVETTPAEELAVATFLESAAKYPETPGRDAAVGNGQQADELLDQAGAQLQQLQEGLNALAAATQDLPPLPAVQAAMQSGAERITEVTTQVAPATQDLRNRVEETRKAADWCQHWYYQGLALKQTLDLYLKVVTASEGILVWAANELKSAVQNDVQGLIDSALFGQYTPEQQATIKEAKGNCLSAIGHIENAVDGFQDLQGPLQAAVNGSIDWITDDVTKNCEKYIGPISGDLRIDYYLKGQPYMRTRYKVSGATELFFKKRQGQGDIVHVEGKVRGKCGEFTGSMDLKHVIDGLPGTDYVAFCIPRWVPKSYNIDLEGEVYPDKMKLKFVRPAAIDFKEAKYRFCIVLFSIFQMVPTADFPEVNVPGAEWFFTRATNTAGDEVWFEVPLSAEGDRSTAHFEFHREMDYLKELEFKAYLNLDFKACSPPCE